jgi:hypothetical protein
MRATHILTKRQADKAILDSLFATGGTLACLPKERMDMGKYKPGSMAGKELPPHVNVRMAWVERRRDSDGPYDAVFCISAK